MSPILSGCATPSCVQMQSALHRIKSPVPKRPKDLLDILHYALELERMAQTFPAGSLQASIRRESYDMAVRVLDELRVPDNLAPVLR